MNSKKPFALVILDGFGLNPSDQSNAVHSARTPNFDKLWESQPHTTLVSYGERVGLPEGQMGNSEVGHLNIGAGRVVFQDLSRINSAIKNDQLISLELLQDLAQGTIEGNTIHLAGLVSTGGVHSSLEHISAIVSALAKLGALRIRIHCFTDGRDRPQQAGRDELSILSRSLDSISAENPSLDVAIASICGRYYAMDRDNRWERTQAAYELLTEACGSKFQTPDDAFNFYYTENTSDEFIPPTSVAKRGEESSMSIQDKDSLLFFNFRSDRMKQISKAFFSREDEFDSFSRNKKPVISSIVSLTQYDATFPIMPLFGPQKIENHFGQVVSKAGLRQVRIAETEKYAHVTYFFNGGEEKEIEGETRIVIPSRKDVATYDLLPEMSAIEVKEALCSAINNNEYDVYIANFANCDMVGHTGSFDAAVAACEVVDQCLGEVVASMQKAGGNLLVTADHGNADQMIEYDSGKPHTYHTTHPVPLVLVSNEAHMTLKDKGALCDIAPTALELMGIEQPTEMTGSSLLAKD